MREVRNIIRIDGAKGLYRGFGATFLRESIGFAAFFATYDYLKKSAPSTSDNSLKYLWTLNAGGLSGIACWTLTLPIDNVKTL